MITAPAYNKSKGDVAQPRTSINFRRYHHHHHHHHRHRRRHRLRLRRRHHRHHQFQKVRLFIWIPPSFSVKTNALLSDVMLSFMLSILSLRLFPLLSILPCLAFCGIPSVVVLSTCPKHWSLRSAISPMDHDSCLNPCLISPFLSF